LWKSDGTAKGTVLAADIVPGATSSNPAALTNVNGTIFFSADTGSGRELWKSNGTAAGTTLVRDINPTGHSFPSNLTNASGTLYFAADDGTHGAELWKSNGTAAGTTLVRDINPGDVGSSPAVLTMSGGHLFFTADDGVHGTELWDPPVAPAPVGKPAADDSPGSPASAPSAGPFALPSGGWLVAPPTPNPWRVSGEAAATADVRDRAGDPPAGTDGPMWAALVAARDESAFATLEAANWNSGLMPGPADPWKLE
jgi:ELWxxDGT repeat protein